MAAGVRGAHGLYVMVQPAHVLVIATALHLQTAVHHALARPQKRKTVAAALVADVAAGTLHGTMIVARNADQVQKQDHAAVRMLACVMATPNPSPALVRAATALRAKLPVATGVHGVAGTNVAHNADQAHKIARAPVTTAAHVMAMYKPILKAVLAPIAQHVPPPAARGLRGAAGMNVAPIARKIAPAHVPKAVCVTALLKPTHRTVSTANAQAVAARVAAGQHGAVGMNVAPIAHKTAHARVMTAAHVMATPKPTPKPVQVDSVQPHLSMAAGQIGICHNHVNVD